MRRSWLLLLCLCYAIPSHATITLVNSTSPSYYNSSGSSYTISSTTLNNTVCVVMVFIGNTTDAGTSVTDAGGDTFSAGSTRATDTGMAHGMEIWCAVGVHAAQTAVAINYTGNGDNVRVTEYEYHSTLGAMTADVSSHANNITTSGTSYTGPSITTTGASDLIITTIQISNTSASAVASPFMIEATDVPQTTVMADAYGKAAAAYAAVWTVTTANTALTSISSFTEAAGGGGGGGGLGGKSGIGGKGGFGG
jgi:hypothetical protein